MMPRLFTVLLMCVPGLWAQRGDTVTQKLTEVARVDTPGPSGRVRYIGQSQHHVTIDYAESSFCTLPALTTVNVWLEASGDDLFYVPISPRVVRVSRISGRLVGEIYANSAASYVRLNWSAIGGTGPGCGLNTYYTGTIPTLAFPSVLPAISSQPLSTSFTTNAAGTQLLIANTVAANRIVVYGIKLRNESPAAGAAMQTITVNQNTLTNCLGSNTLIFQRILEPQKGDGINPSWFPLAIGDPGNKVCVTFGSAVQSVVDIFYRVE